MPTPMYDPITIQRVIDAYTGTVRTVRDWVEYIAKTRPDQVHLIEEILDQHETLLNRVVAMDTEEECEACKEEVIRLGGLLKDFVDAQASR